MPSEEKDRLVGDLRAAAMHAFHRTSLRDAATPFMLQLHPSAPGRGSKAAVVVDGAVKMILDTTAGQVQGPDAFAAVPATHLRPLAVQAPSADTKFVIFGAGLDPTQDAVYWRSHDMKPTIEVLASGPAAAVASEGAGACQAQGGWMHLSLPHSQQGAYQLDVQRGHFIHSSACFVALEDPHAVAEVRQLEADATAVADVPSFLHKLGLIAHYRTGDDGAHARLASVAQEIAAVALKRSWPAVLRLALGAICWANPQQPQVALDGVARRLGPPRMCPFKRAVASGSADLVGVLGRLGASTGVALVPSAPGTQELSAFHVAAMLRDPVPMAHALAQAVPDAAQHWSAAPEGAATPLGIAVALGQHELLRELADMRVPAAHEALATLDKAKKRRPGEEINATSGAAAPPVARPLPPRAAAKHDFIAAGAASRIHLITQELSGLNVPRLGPALHRRRQQQPRTSNVWAFVVLRLVLALYASATLPTNVALLGTAIAPLALAVGGSADALELWAPCLASSAAGFVLQRGPAMHALRSWVQTSIGSAPLAQKLLTGLWAVTVADAFGLGVGMQVATAAAVLVAAIVAAPEMCSGDMCWVSWATCASKTAMWGSVPAVWVPVACCHALRLAMHAQGRQR